MSLYQWNTQLYEKVSNIFPKCWLRGRKGRRILKHASDDELKMYIENVDIYLAGIQIILNMGVFEIKNYGMDYGIYYHPTEEGMHVREYKSGPTSGQMGYYYPFKRRTLMFLWSWQKVDTMI